MSLKRLKKCQLLVFKIIHGQKCADSQQKYPRIDECVGIFDSSLVTICYMSVPI